MTERYLIGIDEVGRGPIAGPVAVGAFVFLDRSAEILFRGVKESKQLSEKRREEWFSVIETAKKDRIVDFAVTFRSERTIDERGISFAIRSALGQSLTDLINDNSIGIDRTVILLDGGLRAPECFERQKTIVRGDEKEMVIALASICAKVLRDRKMIKLSKKYPEYGFSSHKGYGTKAHYDAIEKYGLISSHRRSFL